MASFIFFLSIVPGLAQKSRKCLRTMHNRVRGGKLSTTHSAGGHPEPGRIARLVSSQLRILHPGRAQAHGDPAWRRILLQFGEVGRVNVSA
ncbi:hypothetical protein BKA82DRAFT_4196923 [Pisolithus tinctorius]|nr:hypothetical protein BKA82DRAFT_4196923 [Pisolithus tinctorius]